MIIVPYIIKMSVSGACGYIPSLAAAVGGLEFTTRIRRRKKLENKLRPVKQEENKHENKHGRRELVVHKMKGYGKGHYRSLRHSAACS